MEHISQANEDEILGRDCNGKIPVTRKRTRRSPLQLLGYSFQEDRCSKFESNCDDGQMEQAHKETSRRSKRDKRKTNFFHPKIVPDRKKSFVDIALKIFNQRSKETSAPCVFNREGDEVHDAKRGPIDSPSQIHTPSPSPPSQGNGALITPSISKDLSNLTYIDREISNTPNEVISNNFSSLPEGENLTALKPRQPSSQKRQKTDDPANNDLNLSEIHGSKNSASQNLMDEYSKNEVDSDEEVITIAVKKIIKRRGRPPKAKQVDCSQTIKKRMGRPPKAKQVDCSQTIKKRMGRPPKAKQADNPFCEKKRMRQPPKVKKMGPTTKKRKPEHKEFTRFRFDNTNVISLVTKAKKRGRPPRRNMVESIEDKENFVEIKEDDKPKEKTDDTDSSSDDEYQDDLETRNRVLKSATIPYKKTKLGKMYRHINNISVPILLPPIASSKISEALPFLSELRDSSSIETNSNQGESYDDLYPRSKNNSGYDVWVVYLTMQAKVAVGDYYGARTFCKNTIGKWTAETKEVLSVCCNNMPQSNPELESKAALMTKAVGGLWCVYAHFVLDIQNSESNSHNANELDDKKSGTREPRIKKEEEHGESDGKIGPGKRRRNSKGNKVVATLKAIEEAQSLLNEAIECPIASDVAWVWISMCRLLEHRGFLKTIISIAALSPQISNRNEQIQQKLATEVFFGVFSKARKLCKEGLLLPDMMNNRASPKPNQFQRIGVLDVQGRKMLCNELNRICLRERLILSNRNMFNTVSSHSEKIEIDTIDVLSVDCLSSPSISPVHMERENRLAKKPFKASVHSNDHPKNVVDQVEFTNPQQKLFNSTGEKIALDSIAPNNMSVRIQTTTESLISAFPVDTLVSHPKEWPILHSPRGINNQIMYKCKDHPLSLRDVTRQPQNSTSIETDCSVPDATRVTTECMKNKDLLYLRNKEMISIDSESEDISEVSDQKSAMFHANEVQGMKIVSFDNQNDEKIITTTIDPKKSLMNQVDPSEVSDEKSTVSQANETDEVKNACSHNKSNGKRVSGKIEERTEVKRQLDSKNSAVSPKLSNNNRVEMSQTKDIRPSNVTQKILASEKQERDRSRTFGKIEVCVEDKKDLQLPSFRSVCSICKNTTSLESDTKLNIPGHDSRTFNERVYDRQVSDSSDEDTVNNISSNTSPFVSSSSVLACECNDTDFDIDMKSVDPTGQNLKRSQTDENLGGKEKTDTMAILSSCDTKVDKCIDLEWACSVCLTVHYGNEDNSKLHKNSCCRKNCSVYQVNDSSKSTKSKEMSRWQKHNKSEESSEFYVFKSLIMLHCSSKEDVALDAKNFCKSRAIFEGQVGVGCLLCKNKNATIYPQSLSQLYSAIWDLSTFHFRGCKAIPSDLKQQYKNLRDSFSLDGSDMKIYCENIASENGFVDEKGGGIRRGNRRTRSSRRD